MKAEPLQNHPTDHHLTIRIGNIKRAKLADSQGNIIEEAITMRVEARAFNQNLTMKKLIKPSKRL
jgi:hypothetical protein